MRGRGVEAPGVYSSWEAASEYAMPFGKYEGKKLGDIAKEPNGLSYLKWASVKLGVDRPINHAEEIRNIISKYLTKPEIKEELKTIVIYEDFKAERITLAQLSSLSRSCVGLGEAINGLCHCGQVREAKRLSAILRRQAAMITNFFYQAKEEKESK